MPVASIGCHEKTKVTISEYPVGQEIEFRNWNLGVGITENHKCGKG